MSSTFLQFLKISKKIRFSKNLTAKLPGCRCIREESNYRYLAVETFTPGPMVEATVQERIY